jgi:UDP-glucose 4,6-dehydratase
MLMTILITGGCGAIGSEVINRLKSVHKSTLFINLDTLTYAGKEEHIEQPHDNYVFVKGNVCDVDTITWVLNKYKPRYILHFAAETHVDNSFGNSLNFTKSNVLGTHVLLECAKEYIRQGNILEKFLHMSTDEVYGPVMDGELARTENSLLWPTNPYAATKAGAEMICKSYERSFSIPIVIMRCNNAISKYQNIEKLIPKVVSSILHDATMPVHGEGKSKRTFIHAYDIASAIDIILSKGVAGQTYNIGTDTEYSVMEVIHEIERLMGKCAKIEYVPDRAFQDYRYYIDATALKGLGWQDSISFEDAITDVISHLSKSLITAIPEKLV